MAYKIQIEGKEYTIDDESMWARDVTMKNLVNALTGKGGSPAEREKTRETKSSTRSVKAFGKTLFKMNPALSALESGFNALGSVISGTAGLVGAMSQMTGRFSDLGAVVDFSRDMIKDTLGRLPIFGGFISASAEAAAELSKLKLTLFDLQGDTFEALASTGVSAQTSISDLIIKITEANISVDQFNRLTLQNADALRVFGGTADMAAKKFSDNIESLTSDTSDVGIELRMLGLNAESIVDEFANFIDSNKFNTTLMKMDAQDLNQVMVSRIKAERTLAEFTGKSVQEQQAEFRKNMADSAFQATMYGKVYQTGMTQLAGIGGVVGDLIKEVASPFGTALNKETAQMISLVPGLDSLVRSVIDNVKAANTQQEAIEAATRGEVQIQQLLGNQLQTANGQFISSLGLVDGNFRAFGDALLEGSLLQTQIQNMNKQRVADGKPIIEDEIEAMEEVARIRNEAARVAGEMMRENGKVTAEQLKQRTGIDEATANIIIARMEQEETVGDFQSMLQATVQPLDGFAKTITGLNNLMQGAMNQMGLNPDMPTTAQLSLGNYGGTAESSPFISGGPKAQQFGGPGYANQTYMVGENGPELFVPTENGTFLPDPSAQVTKPSVSRLEDAIVQANSPQDTAALVNAMSTAKLTTSDPDAIGELRQLNRNITKLAKTMSSDEGIY